MYFWKCFCYCFCIGVASFLLGRLLARCAIDPERGIFRCFDWERGGRFYESFGIRRWYKKLPDMSRIVPAVMPKKKLESDFATYLPRMIRETCVAEIVHIFLSVAGLFCLVIWPGIGGVIVVLLFSVLMNVPFIMIQRYNRPRLIKLYRRCCQRQPHLPPIEKTAQNSRQKTASR